MKERSVGIIVHRTNPRAWALALDVLVWLQERGIIVRFDAQSAQNLHQEALTATEADWDRAEFVLTLGGDGTILTAARMAAPRGIPILGVHMGRFGFIAETHPSTLYNHLQRTLDGQTRIEERLMIRAEIWRDGALVHHSMGLNDAVIKSSTSSLLDLHVCLGGAPFATYPADGLIIATPTGSTGYSLSAGGPIVEPTIQALIITPICPHTLSARPMVIPSEDQVEVHIEENGGDVLFKADGIDPFPVRHGDRVAAGRSEFVTRLIMLETASFYRKVRARYLYGERLNHPEAEES